MAADRINVGMSDGFHVHFSSTDRQSGSDSDFTISCSIPTPPSGLDFNRVAAVDVAIPKSWYLVNTGNNTFQLQENDAIVTVTVPVGNYTLQQWVTQIPPIITAASPNGWVYTAIRVVTPDLGVIRYTVTGSAGVQPRFIVNAAGDVSQQLGFPSGTWPFVGGVLQGTIPYNATGEFGIRLRSDICEAEGDSTLADILDVGLSPPGSIIRFQLQECLAQTKRFHRTGSTAFRFWLVSATTGRPINTNGLPVVVHLKIYRLEDNAIWVSKDMLSQLKTLNTVVLEMSKQAAGLSTAVAEMAKHLTELKSSPPPEVQEPEQPLPQTPAPPPPQAPPQPLLQAPESPPIDVRAGEPQTTPPPVLSVEEPPEDVNVRAGEPQTGQGTSSDEDDF